MSDIMETKPKRKPRRKWVGPYRCYAQHKHRRYNEMVDCCGRMNFAVDGNEEHYLVCQRCGWESKRYEVLEELKRRWKDYRVKKGN